MSNRLIHGDNLPVLNTLEQQTQKPESLLECIITASSNPGYLVVDFFYGSGTTLTVTEKLGCRWLGVDSSPLVIQVCKERLNMGD